MKRDILIIANGEHSARLKEMIEKYPDSILVAVDGGFDQCLENGINPDYLTGDFDSVPKQSEFSDNTVIIPTPDQNYTDLEKSLQFIRTINPGTVRILSAVGKRTDHTFNSISLLLKYAEVLQIELFDNFGYLKVLSPNDYFFNLPKNTTVSLFSWKEISSLSLQGFKYSIENISEDNFLGISNETDQTEQMISFKKGHLFVYILDIPENKSQRK
ncbi:MAG: thiamine diphosphokinase [Candidatus Cloacimonetes bacterium]|nr:thiamine diphosphokinase [Candidatus Cloacimonadota bacterium]